VAGGSIQTEVRRRLMYQDFEPGIECGRSLDTFGRDLSDVMGRTMP
jgi:hypothetical protein